MPKIIAADGVNIISKFDVLGQDTGPYANSQVGQIWGSNNNVGTPATVPNTNANTISATSSRNQGATNLKVSQLYLNINQEYGALVVGRAPFQFGLGMTYNSGAGLFDHWYQTRDMVAYKFVVGDWSFMPMSSRVYSESPALGNSINEMGAQLLYDNKDNRTTLGLVYNKTNAGSAANDASMAVFGADSTKPIGSVDLQRTNFYYGRDWDSFGFKFEAGFETGATGLQNANSQGINISAYGAAMELIFPKTETSKWDYNFRLGMASGDNPDSATYEGYQFDQNYDVAMLLFNHRLGQKDFFGTNRIKDGSLTVSNSVDDEAIGNTMYISPAINYAWNDRLDLKNTFTYAQILHTQKNSVDAKKDLGLEWDIELIYKPVDRIRWVNQIGLLFPGPAWKNGDDPTTGNFQNGFTYGFASKAAISF
jgi:hypothetical protein